jgi:predicted enzyme related to lactoylglutathione lyase
MANALTWFEIPVVDMRRAVGFYEAVLDLKLTPGPGMGPVEMMMFPSGVDEVGGALVAGRGYVPAATGSIVYLGFPGDLNVPLGRVAGAGGKIILPKTDIGENGFFAFVLDTEGNRVGLHSMQ